MAFVPSLLTIREICDLIGVSRRTVSRWITRGMVRRAGQLTVPAETRGGSLVLVEVADAELSARLAEAALLRINAGQPMRFLADRLALAALGDRLEASSTTEDAAQPATELARLMTGFDQLIEHLGTVRSTSTERMEELQNAADRLRTDAAFAARTHELEEILHAVQEVRRRESALLLASARSERSGTQDGIVELEDESNVPFEYSERDDAIDAAYLSATPDQLASEEATVSEILRWMPLDPTFDLPPGDSSGPAAGQRPTLTELSARLEKLNRLQAEVAQAIAEVTREIVQRAGP